MRILSLFNGISCGRVAFEKAGFDVTRYISYEIDESANVVAKHNYPNDEYYGDVFQAKFTDYENQIDVLIGGSPCTHWSIAKAGGGSRETTASGIGWELFMQYVRALREAKPKYFLYENNFSMSDDIKNEITKQLGVEPIMLDSANLSVQERKRYYWTNIPVDTEYVKCDLVIKDILYDHNYNTINIDKYLDSVRWNADKTKISWDTSGKGYYSQQSRARRTSIKLNTIPASGTDKNNFYLDNGDIRKIHPIEAERGQCLPDNYTSVLTSKNKRVSCVGNGWTVDVIVHLIKNIKINGEK